MIKLQSWVNFLINQNISMKNKSISKISRYALIIIEIKIINKFKMRIISNSMHNLYYIHI
jgi:hypothetical protein